MLWRSYYKQQSTIIGVISMPKRAKQNFKSMLIIREIGDANVFSDTFWGGSKEDSSHESATYGYDKTMVSLKGSRPEYSGPLMSFRRVYTPLSYAQNPAPLWFLAYDTARWNYLQQSPTVVAWTFSRNSLKVLNKVGQIPEPSSHQHIFPDENI